MMNSMVVFAYIDPSAITYLIQIGVGALVTIGAVIGIVISKIKKKAKEKLTIDFDKNKTVEEDVVEYIDSEEETKSDDSTQE